MHNLWAILGLGALCGAWVGLQLWLLRVDPELAKRSSCCSGCGNHNCEEQPKP